MEEDDILDLIRNGSEENVGQIIVELLLRLERMNYDEMSRVISHVTLSNRVSNAGIDTLTDILLSI